MKRWLAFFLLYVMLMIGLILILLPWSQLWTDSIFTHLGKGIRSFYQSAIFKGAISGVGLLTLLVSIEEAIKHILNRTK